MEFAEDDVVTWPYPDRQLIVVERDAAVEILRRAESEGAGGKLALNMLKAAALVAFPGGVALAAATAAAVRLWKARKRAESANLPFLVVTSTQAGTLSFPNGHPLQDVVYVGDPGVAGNYYPVASFHRFLFEGKVAEALRLLRSLGATEISIECREGFDRAAGVDLSVSPQGAGGEIGGGVNGTNKADAGAKIKMHLSPILPAQIPKDLTWFGSEPLWREVASARLESGLREFSIDVSYMDDFGVNAILKAKIASVGLGLGGSSRSTKRRSGSSAGRSPSSCRQARHLHSDRMRR